MPAGGFVAAVGRLQLQVFKEDIGKLLGGIDVERPADRLIDLLFDLCHAFLEPLAGFHEERQVQRDAGHFHVARTGVSGRSISSSSFGPVHAPEGPSCRIGMRRKVVSASATAYGAADSIATSVHGDLFLALADQLLDVGHLFAKPDKGQVLQTPGCASRDR